MSWTVIKPAGNHSNVPSIKLTRDKISVNKLGAKLLGKGNRFLFMVSLKTKTAVIVASRNVGYKLTGNSDFTDAVAKQLLEQGVPPGMYELVPPPRSAPEESVVAICWKAH